LKATGSRRRNLYSFLNSPRPDSSSLTDLTARSQELEEERREMKEKEI